MGSIIRLTDDNFEREVLSSRLPVLVDFWASWCPPCKMVEPVVAELAEEYRGKIKVGKLNVDQNPRTAQHYNILGVPTFVVFSDGNAGERRVGAQSKAQLSELLRVALKDMESSDTRRPDAIDQSIDEEEQIRDRLRALGYVE